MSERVLIIDATRVGDVRVYEDEIAPTVIQRYGTGGGNVPMVFPIQDGREMEKKQNGLGVGQEGEPSYTLDQTGAQAVVIPIQGSVIGRKDHNGLSRGFKDEGDPMFTLVGMDVHTVAVVAPTLSASNNPSRSPQSSEITAQVDAMVRETGIVRRLTPLECERLQGFPDGWTEEGSNGKQADSNRYKQMGNAVAVPVVEWIVARLKEVTDTQTKLGG